MAFNADPLALWDVEKTSWKTTPITYSLYLNTATTYNWDGTTFAAELTSLLTQGKISVASTIPTIITSAQGELINYFLLDKDDPILASYSSLPGPLDYRVSFSDVSNIHFNYVANGGSAIFGNADINPDPTHANSEGDTGWANRSLGNPGWNLLNTFTLFDNNIFGSVNSQTDLGQQGAFTILHELGHVVGLDHTQSNGSDGDTNAGYTGQYSSQKYSVMTPTEIDTAPSDPDSYNPQDPDMLGSGNTSSVWPAGLQLYDIASVQAAYGRNYSTRDDDTVYTVGHPPTNEPEAFGTSPSTPFIYTIWDGGGTDLIDASPFSNSAQIDLRQGHFSSIGYKDSAGDPVAFDTPATSGTPEYDSGNVAVAYHTVIENAFGTDAADSIIGNDWSNVLYGAGGNDKIYGDGQTYDANRGFNVVTHDDLTDRQGLHDPNATDPLSNPFGQLPHDVLIGGAGNDTLFAGIGNDVLDGGYNKATIDTATAGWTNPDGSTLYWDSAGQFTGTNNALHTAVGNLDPTSDGNDTADYSGLYLGQASDFSLVQTITGTAVTVGANPRFPDYVDATTNGVSVFMTSTGGTVDKGAYGQDQLFSIENVVGTAGNDFFTGANGSTDLSNPLTYNGGAGNDVYSFSDLDNGVVKIVDPSGTDMLDINLTESVDGVQGTTSWKLVTIDGLQYLDITAQHGTSTPSLQVLLSQSDIDNGAGVDFVQFSGSNLTPPTLTPKDIENFLTYLQAHPSDPTWGSLYNATTHVFTGGMSILPTHAEIQQLADASSSGGVSPTFDGSGNIETVQVAGGTGVASNVYATEDLHPFVVTSFNASGSGSDVDLTGVFCTSRIERLRTRKEPGNAEEDVHAGADRSQAAAD